MQQRGTLEQSGHFGVWRLVDSDAGAEGAFGPVVSGNGADHDVNVQEEASILDERIEAAIELGEGPQLVYCFYLAAYRYQAENEGDSRWPVKIGRTTGSLPARLANLSTAMPEPPIVAVLIHTHDADLLEKAIQTVLSYRGRWLSEAGGAEWYLTNPDEIVRVYEFIHRDEVG